MILKSSQRAHGSELAVHLSNGFDNEEVEIAQIRGCVASDLLGAFAEFEAIASGTKCKQPLYSLSINPSSPLSRSQYFDAIDEIEKTLGLKDQPRSVVFHIKEGRKHAHVVWSRIDVNKMRAIPMSFDHSKLMSLSVKLANKFDLELPEGLKAWEQKDNEKRAQLKQQNIEPSLSENANHQKSGISAKERAMQITAAYESSDNAKAFISALQDSGYTIARGDRRNYVLVDEAGDVFSLTRYIKGHRAKEIKAKLSTIKIENLPSVNQAKEQKQLLNKENSNKQDSEIQVEVENKLRQLLKEEQALRKAKLISKEQGLLTKQASERLSLHQAQITERKNWLHKARNAVARFIEKTPALRSVLGSIQNKLHLDPNEKHEHENKALALRHSYEKKDIEREKKFLKAVEKCELRSLERKLKRQRLIASQKAKQARQEFSDAANIGNTRRKANKGSSQISSKFNQNASIRSESGKSEEGDAKKLEWKARVGKRKNRKKKKSRGYGYSHNDENNSIKKD